MIFELVFRDSIAEINNFDLDITRFSFIPGNEDVLSPDISMDYLLLVEILESLQ